MSESWCHTKSVLLSLEKQIKCNICHKLPEDPHLLWCKHSYCKKCIAQLSRCPECSYPVKAQDVVRNIMLDHLLNAIKCSSEMVCSNATVNNEDKLEERVEQKTHVDKIQIEAPKDKVNKTDKEEKLVSHKKNNQLKLDLKRRLSLEEKNVKCKEKNEQKKSQNHVLKSSTTKNIDQCNVEKKVKPPAITQDQRSRRTSTSAGKQSLQEANKSIKNTSDSLESSIQCIPDRFNTPKSKSNSMSIFTPKSVKNKSDSLESSIQCKPDTFKTPKSKSNSMFKFTPKSSILFSAKKLQTSKVNVKGETPLQIACRQGKLELVRKLLDEGAEPNVKDYANWTPLCDAVGSGNIEVVKALLVSGAGVNTPSNLNTTALVEAVARRDKALVKLLLSYGADMHQRTSLNNTALSIADDEMKSVLTSVRDITVQPYPRVRPTPRAVLANKLSLQHVNQLVILCQQFNLTLSTVFTEDISHIVVEKTEDNKCQGSLSVMMGILSSCSVVGTDWVTACLARNELLSPEEFEPNSTDDFPNTDVFSKARLNRENLLPRLFDGCHISLQHDQTWPEAHKHEMIGLIQAAGAVYQPRQCDAERIPLDEQTVMFHASKCSSLALVSHIILYQPGPSEPLLKYNMAHVKTLSVTWFMKCIKTFSLN